LDSEENTAFGLRLVAELARWLLALVFASPFLIVLWTWGSFTDQRGHESFYNGALGILGALIIAMALQIRETAEGLWRIMGRAETITMVITLFGYVGALIAGSAATLHALQDCSGGTCGTSRDLNHVIVALVCGAAYLITAFGVALFIHLVELRRASDNGAEG
jgi:hypothetical protein